MTASKLASLLALAFVLAVPAPRGTRTCEADFWSDFDQESLRLQKIPSLFKASSDWTGPLFAPSLDFPTSPPSPETGPWLAVDFTSNASGYMAKVLEYIVEGNDVVDWRVQDNTIRKWFHAPWMTFDPKGREPIRGLTSERGSRAKELAPTQTTPARNWAVGIYNAPGGFTLGQVWANPRQPTTTTTQFPAGTVSAKLLFTDALPAQVSFLDSPAALKWQAAVDGRNPNVTAMDQVLLQVAKPKELRLLQLDIAVRDDRVSTGAGWVFGTFYFDGAQPGSTWHEKLVPVGLMWGNDPDLTHAAYAGGQRPVQGWLNPPVLAKFQAGRQCQEMGLRGRVNGPVDNPLSSCLSCHGRALDILPTGRTISEFLDDPSILGNAPGFTPPSTSLGLSTPCNINAAAAAAGEPTVKQWFRNLASGVPFTPGFNSLDYSLQLADGIGNFYAWALEFKEKWTPAPIPDSAPVPTPEATPVPGPETTPSPPEPAARVMARSPGRRRPAYSLTGFRRVPKFGRGDESDRPTPGGLPSRPGLVRISRGSGPPIEVDLVRLSALPYSAAAVLDERGCAAQWEGPSLETVLGLAGIHTGAAVEKSEVARYLRVIGRDGSSAVVALPETQHTHIMIALRRNGTSLSAGDGGPARLVIPAETHRVRWIADVVAFKVE